jgi:hypothetical protein
MDLSRSHMAPTQQSAEYRRFDTASLAMSSRSRQRSKRTTCKTGSAACITSLL